MYCNVKKEVQIVHTFELHFTDVVSFCYFTFSLGYLNSQIF